MSNELDNALLFARDYSIAGHSGTVFGLQEIDKICEAMCLLASEVERLREEEEGNE